MKNSFTKRLGLLILFGSLLPLISFSQENNTPEPPQYLIITTLHWNLDYENYDKEEWLKVEKEYFDKVTSKNDHIRGFGFMNHILTTDNTEALWVASYNTWSDIEKSWDKNEELIKEAWPNEDESKAFFKKQMAYYQMEHSDEIYRLLPGSKPLPADVKEPMIYYMRVSEMQWPEEGNKEEIESLMQEYRENVTYKNSNIKGYYVFRHGYGANSTNFCEVYVLSALADMDAMYEENSKLMKENWSEEEGKAKMKVYRKYFTGKHADYVYQSVPELRK